MCDLTTIILTLNEEKNIAECINSVKDISKRIVVVDSFSTDKTVEIAKELGAEVIQNKFINQAQQFNYAIDVLTIDTKWIFRIDADERLTDKSSAELAELIEKNSDNDVNGIVVRFEVSFLGKKLHHGGIYPLRILRVFKTGKAKMEAHSMDERISVTEGTTVNMKTDIEHKDYKDLTAWIEKHNKYSSREVIDYNAKNTAVSDYKHLNFRARVKRFIKFKIYYKLPMGMRAHMYYIYRQYFRLGFLDGKEGKIFNFLQAYWYRFLVDAKIFEDKKNKSEGK